MNMHYFFARHVINHRVSFKNLAGYVLLASTVASCGGEPDDDASSGSPITITPTPATVTPTPVVTPTPATVTPTPVVTPTPATVTPTPVVTPTPATVTPTPVVTPTPITVTPTPATPTPSDVVYAINVGSDEGLYVDNNLEYTADTYFEGGNISSTDIGIASSDIDAVYQTERWGTFSYNLPVTNGTYQVTLQFAEIYWDRAGSRVLSVDVENNREVSNLDIFAEVGANTAFDHDILAVSVDDGILSLTFSAETDAAKLSGIIIRNANDNGITPVTPTPTPTPVTVTPTPTPIVTPTPVVTPTPTPAVTPDPTVTREDYASGEAVYNANCAGCHGTLADSEKRNRSQAEIEASIANVRVMQNISLTDEEYRVLVYALNFADPDDTTTASGEELYQQFGCTACHGNDGLQESQPIVFDNYSYETFLAKVENDMPPNAPDSCVGECAEAVSQYIWNLRPQVSCDVEQILPRRIRQLSKFEYVNTINDLFNRTDAEALSSGIGSDTEVNNFDNNAEANRITSLRMDAYWNTAESIAASSDLSPWLSTNNCSNQNDIGYCFAEKFGREAFRRDLTDDEKDQYQALFNEGASDTEGASIVAQTMLVSSSFLYRTELGEGGELTQYEIANLLSYTFWGSMPDDTLLDKAASNALSTSAQLEQEVERLIADQKASKQFIHFGRQWLGITSVQGLDRDADQFPSFTDDVAEAMDAEVELFLAEVMLTDGYNVGDLFQSDFVYANQALADFYGLSAVNGSDMQKVTSNGTRGGVLTFGSLLARNAKFDDTHPILRGLSVRNNLLCQEFGTPPAVIGEVEPFDPDKPTRERFAAHTANEACASCHQFIDEIGFAFENYDAVGKYRTTEGNDLAIDATGSISGLERMTDSDTHNFNNLQDLSWILATEGLAPTSSCFVETFQRMAQGVAEPDSCTTDNISTRWTSGSLKDLWVEAVSSQSFTQRQ